jgi:hypothetical protein
MVTQSGGVVLGLHVLVIYKYVDIFMLWFKRGKHS